MYAINKNTVVNPIDLSEKEICGEIDNVCSALAWDMRASCSDD